MARPKIQQRPYRPNDRLTGYGTIAPGHGEGRDYGQELKDEIAGQLGGKHTAGVNNSFRIRGKRAYEKGR